MEEWLLLDGIEAHGDHGAIREADEAAVAVLAHAADPETAGADQAAMGAHAAADRAIRLGFRQDGRDRIGLDGREGAHARLLTAV